jgi:lysine decarboxylase
VGTVGDVGGYAEVAHAAGVPLVVDAAWGAHFGLHPALPAHPLAAGADAVVTSAHKMLPAISQAAIVLARTQRLDAGRLGRAFDATHTTSPAGAILASTDAARALVERSGRELAARLVDVVGTARARLAAVPGLRVLSQSLADGSAVDAAKLVVLLPGTGAHGTAVERDLVAAGYPVEMADRDTIVAIVTLADDDATVGGFVDELTLSVGRHRGHARPPVPAAAWTVDPEQVIAPREAFFCDRETVPAPAAVGRVSAELVAPYPPGVPVLAPGERITAAGLAALEAARDDGALIAYAADPALATLAVVRA